MSIIIDPEGLRQEGYGWKKVKIRCACGWKGKRIWGKRMFKPCPRCNRADGLHGPPPHVVSPQETRKRTERLLIFMRVLE